MKRKIAPEAGFVVIVAYVLDLLGEPPAAWHPVVWYGKLIRQLEQRAPQGRFAQLLYGTVLLPVTAPLILLLTFFIQWLSKQVRTVQGGVLIAIFIEGSALKPFFALRMLVDAGRIVRLALQRHDLSAARQALQSLVSRDRSQLTEELIAAAAIESLAENLSDSVVAPLFYYALAGLPGAALYRLYNTFDSMIGYHGRYEYLGKAAARLDDLLNLVPAKLTALLILLCAPLFGGKWRATWRIWRRDAGKTASPNAGHPMAAAAGALGVQLEKVDHYVLGEREQGISAQHIQQAERMVWIVGTVALSLTMLYRIVRGKRDE